MPDSQIEEEKKQKEERKKEERKIRDEKRKEQKKKDEERKKEEAKKKAEEKKKAKDKKKEEAKKKVEEKKKSELQEGKKRKVATPAESAGTSKKSKQVHGVESGDESPVSEPLETRRSARVTAAASRMATDRQTRSGMRSTSISIDTDAGESSEDVDNGLGETMTPADTADVLLSIAGAPSTEHERATVCQLIKIVNHIRMS